MAEVVCIELVVWLLVNEVVSREVEVLCPVLSFDIEVEGAGSSVSVGEVGPVEVVKLLLDVWEVVVCEVEVVELIDFSVEVVFSVVFPVGALVVSFVVR